MKVALFAWDNLDYTFTPNRTDARAPWSNRLVLTKASKLQKLFILTKVKPIVRISKEASNNLLDWLKE